MFSLTQRLSVDDVSPDIELIRHDGPADHTARLVYQTELLFRLARGGRRIVLGSLNVRAGRVGRAGCRCDPLSREEGTCDQDLEVDALINNEREDVVSLRGQRIRCRPKMVRERTWSLVPPRAKPGVNLPEEEKHSETTRRALERCRHWRQERKTGQK